MTKRELRKAEYAKELVADRAYANRDRVAESLERINRHVAAGEAVDAGFHAANLTSRMLDRHPELDAARDKAVVRAFPCSACQDKGNCSVCRTL